MRRLAFMLALAGCGGAPAEMNDLIPPGATDQGPEAVFFTDLPKGDAQLTALCARNHADKVARGLCAKTTVRSLGDLQHAVGLFDNAGAPPQFALTGHSTSLVARSVSAINPRAIIFTQPSMAPTRQQNDGSFVADPGFVALGFVRGEQFVELAAHDAQSDQINFYLVRFTQSCNYVGGCTPADLLTPSVEKNWKELSVYEDEDLKNTVFDCRQCHQPNGPSARKMLRLQERRAPWTHWFRNNKNQPGGVTLLSDFQRAHGTDEDYAGIPAALLSTPRSDPLVLEALVDNNSVSPQPNEFNTGRIEGEVQNSQQSEPVMNVPPGSSQTWRQIFAQSVAGNAIQVPYHDVKVSDPQKLATLADAYRAGGAIPDIRDIFLAEAEPEMGFRPAVGLDGTGILVQTCSQCHNGRLDPSLSRARFDVANLSQMTRAEKDQAIARLQLAPDATRLMPPRRFARLSSAEIAAAVAVLQK